MPSVQIHSASGISIKNDIFTLLRGKALAENGTHRLRYVKGWYNWSVYEYIFLYQAKVWLWNGETIWLQVLYSSARIGEKGRAANLTDSKGSP
jgi:hypothetical protein